MRGHSECQYSVTPVFTYYFFRKGGDLLYIKTRFALWLFVYCFCFGVYDVL